MATFTWFPDASTRMDTEPRVASARFGDGYEQRTPMGINTMPEKWSLVFTGSNAEINAIDSFLRARQGAESFTWTTPDQKTATYLCRKWTKGRERGVKSSISAEFEQVFGS